MTHGFPSIESVYYSSPFDRVYIGCYGALTLIDLIQYESISEPLFLVSQSIWLKEAKTLISPSIMGNEKDNFPDKILRNIDANHEKWFEVKIFISLDSMTLTKFLRGHQKEDLEMKEICSFVI